MSNYTLDIISHHSKFNNQALKKYYVEGIETVGAWGDEPFEIRFKNNTYQKVQVKISVDGTDVLTGKPADTEVSQDMWVVNGYATLSLKAWPENNNGGAGFVFTSADKSVAVHTHGNLSSRGIIAVAVFVEGHVEPIRLTPPYYEKHHHHHHYPYNPIVTTPITSPVWIYNTSGNSFDTGTRIGGTTYSSNTSSSINMNVDQDHYNESCTLGDVFPASAPAAASHSDGRRSRKEKQSLESLVAVGAGQHVDQKITYVTGLIKPTFTETLRVRYLWWDELKDKLQSKTVAEAQPSGFPGDHDKKNIDLGCTPRIGEKSGSFRRAETQQPVFSRF